MPVAGWAGPGKPGLVTNLTNVPREIFTSGRETAGFIALPVTIDGTLTSWAQNSPYIFVLPAGLLMGRVTSTNKWSNSVIGLSSAPVTVGATTITTDTLTAAELTRRIGASGTFTLTGPATAGGIVGSQVVTYSSISGGTITCTATTLAFVSSSLIGPNDGSQTILSILCGTYGTKDVDQTNVNRIDIFDPFILANGGAATINDLMIINYPADTALRSYIKNALKSGCGGVTFQTDQTG